MSLRFAILTALAERQSTGIEVARRFDRSIGYFWTASHQQIYLELDKLASDGLAEQSQTTGPVRRGQPKSFAITESGLQALAAWTGEEGTLPPLRDAALVRLRAAAALDAPELAITTLRQQMSLHEAQLATYREIEERDFNPVRPDSRAAIQYLILRFGIEREQTHIAWCLEGLAALGADASPASQA